MVRPGLFFELIPQAGEIVVSTGCNDAEHIAEREPCSPIEFVVYDLSEARFEALEFIVRVRGPEEVSEDVVLQEAGLEVVTGVPKGLNLETLVQKTVPMAKVALAKFGGAALAEDFTVFGLGQGHAEVMDIGGQKAERTLRCGEFIDSFLPEKAFHPADHVEDVPLVMQGEERHVSNDGIEEWFGVSKGSVNAAFQLAAAVQFVEALPEEGFGG
ncbi:MAG: hypothetical protein ACK5AZ_25035 [Bryobacteraceae bacterium]